MKVNIRPYDSTSTDGERVADICCDAGFLGDPIDEIFRDREFFARFMVSPYLLIEPHHTWVAEAGGSVVGYLNGSMNPLFGYLRMQMEVMNVWLGLLPAYLGGHYNDHPRSKRFAEFILMEALTQIPRHPPHASHFHYNVLPGFRGQGVGGRLIETFEAAARDKGFKQVYCEVMSSPTWRPESYFTALGYRIYHKVRTTVFDSEVDDLHVLCVEKDL
jgi:GNAT superfamily N-acetyltransferase